MSQASMRTVRPLSLPKQFPPDWAVGWGVDKYGVLSEFRVGDVVHRLRWIAPGTFQMGSPKSESNRNADESLHVVTLTKGYWLGEAACPQSLWEAVMGNNPSEFKGADRPVENVSWDDCQAFLDRANGLFEGGGIRLPTEAEWEYAYRAGTTTPFWFGQELTAEQANFGKPNGETTAVKAAPCNGWGLFQMHGNVWEWCQDWLGDYPEGPIENPAGLSEGTRHVIRGGGWLTPAGRCRSAARLAFPPDANRSGIGFRLTRGQ